MTSENPYREAVAMAVQNERSLRAELNSELRRARDRERSVMALDDFDATPAMRLAVRAIRRGAEIALQELDAELPSE